MTVPASGQTMDAATAEDTTTASGKPMTRGRIVSFVIGAAALLLLLPIALYFGFIHKYGVNAIYYDQWNDVALLTHTKFFEPYSGHTTIRMLWTQHNESRTFFPNVIVLAFGALTHLNIVTELYLSAVLLLIALLLIILAHRRDVGPIRLIFYLPVAFLVFTLGQFENTLFGYQMSWYLAITALAAAIFLLNRSSLSWLVLFAAIAMAVVGSYSALQGLRCGDDGSVPL
jgi:hypothetical protein